jgi:AraC-like DNA-binding protein
MDPITDVFSSMNVASTVYGSLEATAPWGLRCPAGPYARFGMVARGNCWLTVEGLQAAVALTAGDCFLLPRGSAHTLQDHPDTPTLPICDVVRTEEPGRGRALRHGGGGTPATIIFGKFLFDAPGPHPLRDALPSLIHITADQPQHPALQTTLRLLVGEMTAQDLGSRVVVNRLADILFIQAIRTHIVTCKAQAGWLRALADPQIGIALRAIHENVAHPWTVASLATQAHMSRSAFALRFRELVGEAPLEYLTRWRMCKATSLLRSGERKLIDIGMAVGYESEGAFKRAFKRVIGATPGEFRRASQSASTAIPRLRETESLSNWEEASREALVPA